MRAPGEAFEFPSKLPSPKGYQDYKLDCTASKSKTLGVEPIHQITLMALRGFRVLRGSALLAGSHLKFGHLQPIAQGNRPNGSS